MTKTNGRGPGRPRKGEASSRQTEAVTVRFTADQLAWLEGERQRRASLSGVEVGMAAAVRAIVAEAMAEDSRK